VDKSMNITFLKTPACFKQKFPPIIKITKIILIENEEESFRYFVGFIG
jgi:hypothetical protein